jgi:hypothetical protein
MPKATNIFAAKESCFKDNQQHARKHCQINEVRKTIYM